MIMKNSIKFLSIGLLSACFLSCSDLTFGDQFLGSQPEESGAVLDSMFNSKANADKVLTQAYMFVPYGIPTKNNNLMGGNIMEATTDLFQSFKNTQSDGPVNLYYNGLLSSNINAAQAGSEMYRYGTRNEYKAIRYAWLFIENVSRVPDMTETERSERVAEAKMLIALSYAEMLRYVGGVCWIDHSVSPNESLKFPRSTFAETVNNIIGLLNEAIPHLNWKQNDIDDGRMTKAGAMALKLRVLLFAASPTFNSATKWHPDADEYTCYGNLDDERWKAAMDAGEAFMKELENLKEYEITQPTSNTPQSRRIAFRSGYYDRGGTEVLISTRRGYEASTHDDLFTQRYYSGPTLNYVNMFSWADGTDFSADFQWDKPSKQPFFENGVPTRDPRLYETVAVPGDHYYNDTPPPIYTNHPSYRAETSGFLQMKFILQAASDREGRAVQWPYLRLPEVLLSYAEAINESQKGPNAMAYTCVNEVRKRVGLPALKTGMKREEFREAVLRERAMEFGFEEVRWFDLIRWGRKDDFQKQLYGLSSKGNDANNPTQFTFSTYEIPKRFWAKKWDSKWFLSPIPQAEINKNYGITQNPGW